MKYSLFIVICFIYLNAYSKSSDSLLCSKITYQYDQFEHTKNYDTPMGLSSGYTISFQKVIHKGISTYYLYLSNGDVSPIFDRGVIILLANNHRINKPLTKVSSSVISYGYSVSALVTLNTNDIALLKKYSITNFRLYIGDLKVDDGDKYKTLFNCLVTKK